MTHKHCSNPSRVLLVCSVKSWKALCDHPFPNAALMLAVYITNWHWLMSQSISHFMWWSRVPGSCEPSLRGATGVVLGQQRRSCTSTPCSICLPPLLSFNFKRAKSRKWHVTSTRADFLYTVTPCQTPSSFDSDACCKKIWGRPSFKKSSRSNNNVAYVAYHRY